jgi:Protein of unknown function (DUF3108)
MLAVHALLLMDTPFGRSERERPVPPATPPAATRVMIVDASRPVLPLLPPAPPPRPPSPVETPRAAPAAAAAPKVRSADRPTDTARVVGPPRALAGGPVIAVAAADVRVAVAAPTAPAEGAEPPVYPTRIPASARLAYVLRRGALTGAGELIWQHDGRAYTLSLSGSALGLELIGQASRGVFDAAGLAPERFVDRRRGRDRQAANFDRSAGRITFSGPALTFPLVPGAQDRLSWMVQLPAIVEADAARRTAGTRVAMFIVGARGDADVWTFSVRGPEPVELAAGNKVDALRLTREPRRPYDMQIEVWLDPTRQHLPARVRLTTLPGGDSLELTLVP